MIHATTGVEELDDFAVLFRRYMTRRRITQAVLAKKIKVDRSTISRWLSECVQKPPLDKVLACAEVLELNEAEIKVFLKSAGYAQNIVNSLGHEKIEDKGSEGEPLVPFGTRPVIRPCDFFGQTALLEEIFDAWDRPVLEHIAVIGDRLTGKTSLLNYLKAIHNIRPGSLRPQQRGDWLEEPYQWAVVDFRDPRMQKLEGLLWHLLNELRLPQVEKQDLEHFMEIVEEQLILPTVILMDNIEIGLRSPELDQIFWEAMRHIGTSPSGPQTGFCVTSRRSPGQLEELAAELGKPSPFFNTFDSKTLGPFTEAEARNLLAYAPQPFESAGVDWILEHSRRWPVILQEFCKLRLQALKHPQQHGEWQAECLRMATEKYGHLLSPP
ncbi:MAG: helix-turn-helix domain-containing protein [Gammaproteobacteria bacterium]|nr:helix-turn-helix domain-containing protein [Gammaproteobacteria bacterium]